MRRGYTCLMHSRPRLLVTGGAGYLGAAVVRAARRWDVAYTTYRRPPARNLPGQAIALDLRDPSAVSRAFGAWRPAAVVHTALSNGHPEHVAGIAAAAEAVATAAVAVGARLVHLSSDAVLDGRSAPYADGAPASPLSAYGTAKAAAEIAVAEHHPAAVIVRTSLIFGLAPMDKHTHWLVDGLARGDTVRLFTDEIVCPIGVDNLAAAVLELAAGDVSGLLNVAGAQPLSRWELGVRLLRALGIAPSANLVPALAAEQVPPRPLDRSLDVRRAAALLRTPLLGVDEALAGMRGDGRLTGATRDRSC